MKRMIHTAIRPWLKRLIVWALLLSFAAIPAAAEITQADLVLNPDPLEYEGGNIVLSKQAERIGPDEWKVNVKATITDETVEPPEIEVVFVLDRSTTMKLCANEEAHFAKRLHVYDTCTGHVHIFSCYEQCTRTNNPAHYGNGNNYGHDGGTTCITHDNSKYYRLVCTDPHVHTSACCSCGLEQCTNHVNSGECTFWVGSQQYTYKRRYDYAVEAITSLSNSVTANQLKYVLFSGDWRGDNAVDEASNLTELASISPSGSTYLMKGVDYGCTLFSPNSSTKKIMVIVTDGAATDNKYTSDTFADFTANGGVVFTVGFNHVDPNLSGMVANGGAYYQASNPGQLTDAFTDIGAKLTAMVEDPMGGAVGFDTSSFKIIEGEGSIDGELSNAGNTIYWTPTGDGTNLKGTIEYTYTVKLNDDANTNEGMHGTTVEDPVPLNNPTWFHYGTAKEMKKALFPIPYAAYGVSSLQTTWQTRDGTKIFETTEVEKIKGCDYEFFTPAFIQDYSNTSPIIDGDTTYRYVGTEVYINGVKQEGGLELINPTQPNAYTVYHLYEAVTPSSLIVSKEVTGNISDKNAAFTFELTLPDMAKKSINVKIDGVISTITLNNKGRCTFTLKHGQSAVIYPVNGSYELTETDTQTHTAHYSVNGADYVQALTASGTINEGEVVAIHYLNKRTQPPGAGLDQEQDRAFIEVEKTFTGITKDQIPEDLVLSVAHGSTVYQLLPTINAENVKLVSVVEADGNVTYSWRLEGLAAGEYTLTESNGDLPGYHSTVTGLGTQSVQAATLVFGDKLIAIDKKYLGQDKDAQELYPLGDNTLFVGSVTANAGTAIITRYTLNTSERTAVQEWLKKVDPSLSTKFYFFSIEEQINETDPYFTIDGKTVHYTYQDGTLNFLATDMWSGAKETTFAYDESKSHADFSVVNTYIQYKLQVSKKVGGNMGSRNSEFSFTVTLPDMANQTVSCTLDGTPTTLTLDAQGQAAFTLRHDQTLVMNSVHGPYTVEEAPYGSYVTTVKVNDGQIVETDSVSGEIAAGDTHAAFTNTLNAEVPTGIVTSTGAALAGLMLSAALTAISLAGRRRRDAQ